MAVLSRPASFGPNNGAFKTLRYLLPCLALIGLLRPIAAYPADSALEYDVKATFLFKFAPFVTWPPQVLQKNTFDVCLSGSDEVTKIVPEVAEGQSFAGKPISVRTLSSGENPSTCQILYVARSEAQPDLLDAARGKPILTVTDSGGAVHGIIDFALINNHVRFNIDNGLATAGGVTISSKLLSLANVVISASGTAR